MLGDILIFTAFLPQFVDPRSHVAWQFFVPGCWRVLEWDCWWLVESEDKHQMWTFLCQWSTHPCLIT